jgi:hypothetical protein
MITLVLNLTLLQAEVLEELMEGLHKEQVEARDDPNNNHDEDLYYAEGAEVAGIVLDLLKTGREAQGR